MDELHLTIEVGHYQTNMIDHLSVLVGLKEYQVSFLGVPKGYALALFGHVSRDPWEGDLFFLKRNIDQTGAIHTTFVGTSKLVSGTFKLLGMINNAVCAIGIFGGRFGGRLLRTSARKQQHGKA